MFFKIFVVYGVNASSRCNLYVFSTKEQKDLCHIIVWLILNIYIINNHLIVEDSLMESNNNNVKSFCIVMLLGLFWKMSHRQLQVSAGKTKSHFSPIVLLSLWGIKAILMEDIYERYISKTFLSSGACRMLSADTAHCRASDQSCVQVDIVSPATLSTVLALCCFPPVCLVD